MRGDGAVSPRHARVARRLGPLDMLAAWAYHAAKLGAAEPAHLVVGRPVGAAVPQFIQAGPEARARLARRSPADRERGPVREAIRDLRGDRTIELIPDAGESLRGLKTLASRAATDAGRAIKYGETQEGSLLVWLADDEADGRRRRRRSTDSPTEPAAQVQ